MRAENHHYVPKFVLRNFLSDVQKEHVSVYDKHTDRVFVTAIKNIMAERRFNELQYDDFILSFEPVACKIEESILPRYQKIIERGILDGTVEEKADLSFFIAFQMLRVKAIRDQYAHIEAELSKKVKALGHSMEQVEGWTPLTEDKLKIMHLGNIQQEIGELAEIISQKIIFLSRAAPKRTFYISDNPVTLNNRLNFGSYGNLGLTVKGIEIYLPLSAELMLCALCPSIIMDISQKIIVGRNQLQARAQELAVQGKITFEQMTHAVKNFEKEIEASDSMLKSASTGMPFSSNNENMDFYNSLQMQWANRYVIDMNADFKLARRHNKEFPALRRGRKFSVN
jgi:Protein of unknown function (DUF4238)